MPYFRLTEAYRPQFFFFSLSFLIVAFAQPDVSPLCSILASALGYALFWKGMLACKTKKGRFLSAFCWFAISEAIHLNWFIADKYVGAFIFIFLAFIVSFLALFFGLLSLLIEKNLKLIQILAIASLWTISEWARLFVMSGFSWDPVGLAMTSTLYGQQLVALTGIFGLTFLVMVTNLCLVTSKKVLWSFFALTPYFFGYLHVSYHQKQSEKESNLPLSALLVQTSLYPEQKMLFNQGEGAFHPIEQWNRILSFLQKHREKKVDFIVLSEAVVPYGTDIVIATVDSLSEPLKSIFKHEEGDKEVSNALIAQAIADYFNADVIAGFEDHDRGKTYNAAFLFHPGSTNRERYEKRVLVPMGEYIPFEWCKKFLASYGIQDSFTPGKEAKVFKGQNGFYGVSICYEETYGHLMRENRIKGANVLANLTNDVWYPHSRLPAVHYLHGRLRAVEMGVPLVRACNTGMTCGVDSVGRTIAALQHENKTIDSSADALAVTLPSYTYSTLYTLIGDYGIIGLSFLFLSIACVLKLRRK